MLPSSVKSKGRNLQKLIRDLIIKTNPELTVEDVRSTSMGNQGEDVQLSPKAREYFPFQIECKSRKAMAVYNDYGQAAEHGKHEPVLFIKANNKEPLVVLSAKSFISLVRESLNLPWK